jgi:diguanylate cyclase (GGDEF)-like protein
MKLRNKILIAISLVWATFLAVSYLGSRDFLLNSFIQAEKQDTTEDLQRIDKVMDQLSQSLYTFTSDWSHWNDLYFYMQGSNPGFIANNFNLPAFLNYKINLLTYWSNRDKLVMGAAINTIQKKFTAYPAGLKHYIYSGSPLLNHNAGSHDIRGFIALPDGIMMIASSKISDGNKTQPALGTMISGRFLSADMVQQVAEMTKLSLNLYSLAEIAKDPAFKKAFDTISQNQNGLLVKPINDETLEGFSVIRDINNAPIGMFRMTAPRSIYLIGLNSLHYYLGSFILLGVIFSTFMLWMLRILIIRRLEKLNREVAQISSKRKLSRRIKIKGNDELSSLAKRINSMLSTIQSTHDQLELRVTERTKELQNTNIQLQQEITDRQAIENELLMHKDHLLRLAHYDNLTSLPNRVFFNEILNKALSHALRYSKLIAVLFIDLDRFKAINDALGHSVGDEVLKVFAQRFSNSLRNGDVVARLGGDEFIILLNDIEHIKFAGTVAEKLLHACTQPVILNDNEFFLTASIGISIYPDDGHTLEDLQRNADMAMYKAKKMGGSQYHLYTQEMNTEAHEHIKLEAALRKAITNNEFTLHYQPKFNLNNNLITGVEALIRWEHPELGLISPATFIPLAEETGLILKIGEWALRHACRANKSWQEQGYEPLTMAVNLSAIEFRHQNIAHLVSSILQETGLDAKYLELEITETAIMDDLNYTIIKLNDLRKMGVQIAIDDFGTGYTSINYLKQYPVNILKIDQEFIKGIPHNKNDMAITTAIIGLGHSLGMKVIAEGVETPEQMKYLADEQCDAVQGYYLSRPLTEQKILSLLNKVDEFSENTPA